MIFGTTDLHMHSCYSDDGEFRPSVLVKMAADAGIKKMAITDHNCAVANKEAMETAAAYSIEYCPGIEIDCTFKGINFHVLGYGIDYESPDFAAIEKNIRDQASAAARKQLALINDLGFHITEEEVYAKKEGSYWSEAWNGEIFAEILLEQEQYTDHELLLPYRPGGSRADNPCVNFYWDYCAQGKPCYVDVTVPQLIDVLEIIHRNGGKAVLAHPGVNLKDNYELIDELIPLGFDGIEVYNSYHNPETTAYFLNRAQHWKIAYTRGSDFHGKMKPAVKIGICSG